MGLVNAKVAMRNPIKYELASVEVDALADSGAVHLCIPEHIKLQLELEEIVQKRSHLGRWNIEIGSLCRAD